jgi:hypothetical protein
MAKKHGGKKPSTPRVQTNAGVNPMGPPAKNPNRPASLAAQIRAAGPVISKREAAAIAAETGKTTAQVMAKAQEKGAALGAGLVNAFNNGKLGINLDGLRSVGGWSSAIGANRGTTQALQQLQALRGLQLNKGTAYAGHSTTTNPGINRGYGDNGHVYVPGGTAHNPIILPRNGAYGVTSAAGAGNDGSGGSGGGKGGEMARIKRLFREQMDAARAMQEEYANKTAEQIEVMQLNMDEQIAATQSAADQEIAYLNDLMVQQEKQSQQTQSLLEQQAKDAQAAYAEQARAATALGKAFVPSLEPTAATVQLGDQRKTERNEVNNTLSSLAITSSLGSNSNPLAGLQLA